MAKESSNSGYSKRPMWQWILIYLIVGGIIYWAIYYFMLGGSGSATPTYN